MVVEPRDRQLSQVGGQLDGFSARSYVPKDYRKAVKVMARDIQLAVAAAKLAYEDAGLAPGDVHYVNAHATSTPAGDRSEARAIRAVFGSFSDGLPVSSTKSMTGHLLGAAGAVEALFCVRALETGMLPPTINLEQPDPECELDHVAGKARAARIRVAVSNAFGFGGANSSLVFARDPA